MNKQNMLFAYILVVMSFAVFIKYGFQISFKIDTGYVGPIFLFHALIMAATMFGSKGK